jgi:hypothetical protein
MKKMLALAAVLILLVPVWTFADQLQIRLGYFLPKAVSNSYLNAHPDGLWTIELDQMSFRPRDYNAAILGVSYDFFVNKYVSLDLGLDFYNRSQVGFYNDWVMNTLDQGDFAFPFELYLGNDIVHSFKVGITPLQASVKFLPLGRKARIVPYVGGGASLVFWNVRMFGDMVDFADPYIYTDPEIGDVDVYPVVPVASHTSGRSWGWHAFGGFQVPIGYRVTIDAEARYQGGAMAHPGGLFVGFEPFDLSGLQLSAGLSFWF